MGVTIADIGPPDTIKPGATLFTEYWFGDFQDVGVCVATLSTQPRWLGHLEVTEQGRIGNVRFIGGVPHLDLTSWSYTVTITNKGPAAVAYNLRVAALK
jgi:hypothetical protein